MNLARPYVDGPVLIVFVDTVFDADLSIINTLDADCIIWAKEVEDYQRYGVVVTDSDGYMQRIVEKPSEPISKLANIGLYYMRDWQPLFDGRLVRLRESRDCVGHKPPLARARAKPAACRIGWSDGHRSSVRGRRREAGQLHYRSQRVDR